MSTYTAAVVREQNVDFAVVLVKQHALQPPNIVKNQLAASLSHVFPGNHIVLCAQDSNGRPTYWGRDDIVRFLANLYLEQLPWREYHAA